MLVAEFKLIPEHRAAVVSLGERVLRALAVTGRYTEDQRVEWEALERVQAIASSRRQDVTVI